MDWDDDPTPPRYRLCRAGFAAVGLGLALMGFSAAFELMVLFSDQPRQLGVLIQHPVWTWAINAPITWLTLAGAYLLWAGRSDAAWRRRAGILMVMNAIDAVQWAVAHGEALGLHVGEVGHPWLRDQVGMAFNWIEYALCATLAADLAGTLGEEKAADAGNKVRALAAAGVALWAICLVHVTDWNHGWPLVPRPRGFLADPLRILAWLGGSALTVLTTLNVVALCVAACRRCTRAIAAARPEDEHGLDLLRSRSETWEDDPRK